MDRMNENKVLYLVIVILSVMVAFGIDHYLLGDQMSVLVGLAIGVGPVFLLMLRDLLLEAR